MADNRKYKANAPVYGNLAYDLDALVRERNLEEAGKLNEERQPKPVTRQHAAVQPRQKVSPLALCSVVLLAVMAVGLLLGYVQLNKIVASVGEMKSELSELNDRHVTLLTEYGRTYDLTAVKEMAEAAGMSKPTSGQIEYVDLGGADVATVYRSGGESAVEHLLQSVEQGWQTVVEYFS